MYRNLTNVLYVEIKENVTFVVTSTHNTHSMVICVTVVTVLGLRLPGVKCEFLGRPIYS